MNFNKFLGCFIIILILSTNFAFASSVPEFDKLENGISNLQKDTGCKSKFQVDIVNDMHFVEKKEDDKNYDKYKMKHFKWYQFYYPVVYGIKYLVDSIICLGGHVAMGVHAASSSTSDDNSLKNYFKNKFDTYLSQKNNTTSSEDNTSNLNDLSINLTDENPYKDLAAYEDALNLMYDLRQNTGDNSIDIKNAYDDGNLNNLTVGDVVLYKLDNPHFGKPIYRYLVITNKSDNILTFYYYNMSFVNNEYSIPSELNYVDGYFTSNINDSSQFNVDTLKYVIKCPTERRYAALSRAYYFDPTHLKNEIENIPQDIDKDKLKDCEQAKSISWAAIALGIGDILIAIVLLVLKCCSVVNPIPYLILSVFGVILMAISGILTASASALVEHLALGIIGSSGSILGSTIGSFGVNFMKDAIKPGISVTDKGSLICEGLLALEISLFVSGISTIILGVFSLKKADALIEILNNSHEKYEEYLIDLNRTRDLHNGNPVPLSESRLMVSDLTVNASKPILNT